MGGSERSEVLSSARVATACPPRENGDRENQKSRAGEQFSHTITGEKRGEKKKDQPSNKEAEAP